jgi:hypothetical protein
MEKKIEAKLLGSYKELTIELLTEEQAKEKANAEETLGYELARSLINNDYERTKQ